VRYTGVGGAAIEIAGTVAKITLSREVGRPQLQLDDVLVVRGLQWPVVIGLADMQRHRTLTVRFSEHGALVKLGETPEWHVSASASARLQGALATIRASDDGEPPSLEVVSTAAHAAEVKMMSSDKAAWARAEPVPAALSPNHKPQPEISFHSSKERQYREDLPAFSRYCIIVDACDSGGVRRCDRRFGRSDCARAV
jgi:hypothetical protein